MALARASAREHSSPTPTPADLHAKGVASGRPRPVFFPALIASFALALGPAPLRALATSPTTAGSTDEIRREAAAAFADGEAAFEDGDYATAAEHFARAHALAPHAWTHYNLALSLARSGRSLAAFTAFDELARTATTDAERSEAARERDALRPLLAVLVIRGASRAEACVDGVRVRVGPEGRLDRLLAPGRHHLRTPTRDEALELAAGTTTEVHIEAARRARPRHRVWAGIALGGSSIALGGSAAAAGLATSVRTRTAASVAASAAGVALVGAIAGLVVAERNRRRTVGMLNCATAAAR